jgi:hypothetical protein
MAETPPIPAWASTLPEQANERVRTLGGVLANALRILSERVPDPAVGAYVADLARIDGDKFTMEHFMAGALALGRDPIELMSEVLRVQREQLDAIKIAPVNTVANRLLESVDDGALIAAADTVLRNEHIRDEYKRLFVGMPGEFASPDERQEWMLTLGRLETIRTWAGIGFDQFITQYTCAGGVIKQDATTREKDGLTAFVSVLTQAQLTFRCRLDLAPEIDATRLMEPPRRRMYTPTAPRPEPDRWSPQL